MTIPMIAVIIAPCLKLILCGAMFENALAGATMLAAMLVVSVATISPAIESMIINGPPIRASNATGSEIRVPKITTIALGTRVAREIRNRQRHGAPERDRGREAGSEDAADGRMGRWADGRILQHRAQAAGSHPGPDEQCRPDGEQER